MTPTYEVDQDQTIHSAVAAFARAREVSANDSEPVKVYLLVERSDDPAGYLEPRRYEIAKFRSGMMVDYLQHRATRDEIRLYLVEIDAATATL